MHFSSNSSEQRKNSMLIVYVSLFLTMALFFTATFSWFTFYNTATIASDELIMNASTGLRVNEGESITNVITIDDMVLSEASSVDGRNMYFPVSGSYTSDTTDMLFREGTVGDQNKLYAYKNFKLTSDSEQTYIYVKDYTITVGDQVFNGSTEIVYDETTNAPTNLKKQEECPIRLAFIEDSSDKPKVIDPTALIDSYTNSYNAVGSTNNGVPMLKVSDAVPFSAYYFVTGEPIFLLEGTEERDITLVVWLEGTGENFEAYAGKPVSVDIELESNWSEMEIIKFVDGSAENWVPHDDCFVTMTYKDINSKDASGNYVSRTVVMSQTSDNTWEAPIPENIVTDITFNRLNPEEMEIWNAWYTKVGINDETDNDTSMSSVVLEETREVTPGDPNSERYTTYTIVRSNGFGDVPVDDPEREWKRLSPGEGYWKSTSSGGGGTSGGTTSSSEAILRVYLNIPRYDGDFLHNDLCGNYDMYAIFSDGSKALLTYNSSDYRCTNENIKVKTGITLKSFAAINRTDNTQKTINLDKPTLISSSRNISYEVGDYGRTAYYKG